MFRDMYYKLAGAVCDAVECANKEESDKLLIKALQETEDFYINYGAETKN